MFGVLLSVVSSPPLSSTTDATQLTTLSSLHRYCIDKTSTLCSITPSPPYPPQGTLPHPYGFVVEAELTSENVTLIKIRSPVQVYNKMEEPCLVAMTMKPTLTSEAVAKEMLLNPEERKPLPLDIAHKGNMFVKLQNKR